MAKEKLKKFTEYCEDLLPHEISYLYSISKSKDSDRLNIMSHIHTKVMNGDYDFEFDLDIDKRKYSKTLAWMKHELEKIDVDKRLVWISQCLQSLLLDQATSELDQSILRAINKVQPNDYYFIYFYELLLQYRQHLLIRMQYQMYQRVNDFIERHQLDYKSSRLVFEQLHQATHDVIGTGGNSSHEAIQWKNWLYDNFKNTRLDGLIRHMSAIRYIFVCLQYNMLGDIEKILGELTAFFDSGQNYTRRLLVNLYDNLLVMYDQKQDYEKARYYGYLSIKYDSLDAIIYRNNLVNLLIKMKQYEEALDVIESANFKLKNTRNFHSAIGFVSNHIRCLTNVGRHQEAITKARIFIQAYKSQVLKYRWHRFFSAFHEALYSGELYSEIIKNTEKYKLHIKEKERSLNKKYKLILNQYYQLSRFKSKLISESEYKALVG